MPKFADDNKVTMIVRTTQGKEVRIEHWVAAEARDKVRTFQSNPRYSRITVFGLTSEDRFLYYEWKRGQGWELTRNNLHD